MEIIQYVKWTKPGEKQKFEILVRTTKDNNELKEAIQKEFNVDYSTALTTTVRLRSLINKIREKCNKN